MKTFKVKVLLIALLVLAIVMPVQAQDDIYFVPKKETKEEKAKRKAAEAEQRRLQMEAEQRAYEAMMARIYMRIYHDDVDLYNRQYRYDPNDTLAFDSLGGGDDRMAYDDSLYNKRENYRFTKMMQRFNDLDIVVVPREVLDDIYYYYNSPYYWRPWRYDPWYYSGWYDPWYYGWRSPWYYDRWYGPWYGGYAWHGYWGGVPWGWAGGYWGWGGPRYVASRGIPGTSNHGSVGRYGTGYGRVGSGFSNTRTSGFSNTRTSGFSNTRSTTNYSTGRSSGFGGSGGGFSGGGGMRGGGGGGGMRMGGRR